MAEAADLMINVGGTRPWKAPEANSPVSKAQSKLTDVYSFGLLVWRVAVDGKSPFDFIIPGSLQREEYFIEIERIKQDDELKARSGLISWYPVYIRRRSGFQSLPTPSVTEVMQKLQRYVSDPSLLMSASDELDMLLSQGMSAMLSQGSPTNLLENCFLQKARTDSFYGRLDAILGMCLSKGPDSRDLAGATSLLQGAAKRNLKYLYFPKSSDSG